MSSLVRPTRASLEDWCCISSTMSPSSRPSSSLTRPSVWIPLKYIDSPKDPLCVGVDLSIFWKLPFPKSVEKNLIYSSLLYWALKSIAITVIQIVLTWWDLVQVHRSLGPCSLSIEDILLIRASEIVEWTPYDYVRLSLVVVSYTDQGDYHTHW